MYQYTKRAASIQSFLYINTSISWEKTRKVRVKVKIISKNFFSATPWSQQQKNCWDAMKLGNLSLKKKSSFVQWWKQVVWKHKYCLDKASMMLSTWKTRRISDMWHFGRANKTFIHVQMHERWCRNTVTWHFGGPNKIFIHV